MRTHEPAAHREATTNGRREPIVHEPKPQAAEPVKAREPEPAPQPAEARGYDRPSTPPEQIAVISTTPDEGKPVRKGWWQRRLDGE